MCLLICEYCDKPGDSSDMIRCGDYMLHIKCREDLSLALGYDEVVSDEQVSENILARG